ncbi:uncharacterized protein EI97DRAFT_149501 [Westerdykella ornata]|uniref:Uncharacterized protein n=1 Tax=Westerdykella ornata TaxID=318751 RepID=A0A6A6JBU6_WESOR|nr:uncharacterized protein EI97DRAFT_149501 [Westerdykella ornata]KAF2273684.1 hypothetical protein EI97DRAFT_149501 [Westerdykella ornata]
MRIPLAHLSLGLERRDGDGDNKGQSKDRKGTQFYLVAIAILAIILVLIIAYFIRYRCVRHLRRQGHSSSRSKNEKLPSLFSWRNLLPGKRRPRRNDYSTTLQQGDELDRGHGRQMSSGGESVSLQDPERAVMAGGTVGIDRNTSIRSVMTLPAYSPSARENERIIAREGERGGIDTVVEFPEAPEEEEARREEEMESLYQIRLARRQEAAEREARREARRAARARGDIQALAELRRRADEAAEFSRSQELIAFHQALAPQRERRVSSVQYGDLGLARHDGTRVRASSNASDRSDVRTGLLDSAASISGHSTRGNTLHTHYRGPSAGSIVTSRASSEFEYPEPAAAPAGIRRSSSSPDDDFEVVSNSRPRSRSRSQSRSVSRVGTPALVNPSIEIPREEAPAYENPPNYESPVETRAPGLGMQSVERVPSIQVTPEGASEGRSASPR